MELLLRRVYVVDAAPSDSWLNLCLVAPDEGSYLELGSVPVLLDGIGDMPERRPLNEM